MCGGIAEGFVRFEDVVQRDAMSHHFAWLKPAGLDRLHEHGCGHGIDQASRDGGIAVPYSDSYVGRAQPGCAHFFVSTLPMIYKIL